MSLEDLVSKGSHRRLGSKTGKISSTGETSQTGWCELFIWSTDIFEPSLWQTVYVTSQNLKPSNSNSGGRGFILMLFNDTCSNMYSQVYTLNVLWCYTGPQRVRLLVLTNIISALENQHVFSLISVTVSWTVWIHLKIKTFTMISPEPVVWTVNLFVSVRCDSDLLIGNDYFLYDWE